MCLAPRHPSPYNDLIMTNTTTLIDALTALDTDLANAVIETILDIDDEICADFNLDENDEPLAVEKITSLQNLPADSSIALRVLEYVATTSDTNHDIFICAVHPSA